MPIVTLTTDFGSRDHYVAAMKGVILGIAPRAVIIDITHEIEPHRIAQGAFVLWQALPWFPPGTVHLAIVDPGVGTSRRIILGRFGGCYVIAPDNGLLTLVQQQAPTRELYVIERRGDVSATFHGRDVMAPVAARLARGANPAEFGELTDRLELLRIAARGRQVGKVLHGAVLHVDRFGTLVTNIHRDQLDGGPRDRTEWEVFVQGVAVGGIAETFSDVGRGEPVALVGSSGLLEIAVNQGSAGERFGAAEKLEIELRPRLA